MKRFTIVLFLILIATVSLNGAIINEIMYNPSTELGDDSNFEYLELYIDADENLNGYTIDGIGYTFGNDANFSAGDYVVLAKDSATVAEYYGITVFDQFDGALGNGGEAIVLEDNNGNIIDEVEYDDGGDWPSSPDGTGSSLELVSFDLDNSLPENWQASFVLNGTPGAENSSAPQADPYTIHEIQLTQDPDGASQYTGVRVSTSGIVTAAFGNIFFIQDGLGAWNGIAVDYATDVVVGNEVSFEATVSENYDRTTLINITDFQILGTQDVPAAEVVTTGAVSTEPYEGVLVTVSDVIVTNDSLGFGEWEINDDTAPCRVDDYFNYNYTPVTGDEITSLTGVVEFSYSFFKLEPRSEADFYFGGQDATITVLSPNGGEQWIQGSTHPITWTTFNFAENVKIELMQVYNRDREVLAESTENDGNWEWTIAEDQLIDEYYSIVISAADGGTPTDDSDAAFAIIAPVATLDLVVNEIMYNSSGHDNEWIEIYNNTAEQVDLGGYSIMHNNPDHSAIVLPAGSLIDSQGYFTIQIDHAAQADPFPFTPDFDGTGHWNLMNSDDAIILYDMYDSIVDEVYFSDNGDWDSAADGSGPSLELKNPNRDNSLGQNWSASNEEGGTPGAENSVFTTSNNDDVAELTNYKATNYPNPFNPTTTIKLNNYTKTEEVTLVIYNVLGQAIKNVTMHSQNDFEYKWNGLDNNHKPVSSGVYYYNIKSGSNTISTSKMLLLK